MPARKVTTNPYATMLDLRLRPSRKTAHVALDLFSGCGGLSLGFEAAGFASHGIDCNESCVKTYNANLSGKCSNLVIGGKTRFPDADVVIGGPPCQPFSVRGKQGGNVDTRNGFPAFVAAVKKIRPRAWVLENVRGVMYKNHAYFDGVINGLKNLGYGTSVNMVNCVDYGVPQNRIRVIAMGARGRGAPRGPEKSAERVSAGEAIGDLVRKIPKNPKFLTSGMDRYIAAYERASKCAQPRDLHMDRPARTLTCRNLAGATSDMHRIRLGDRGRRRLTVREAARLQSFPDCLSFAEPNWKNFTKLAMPFPRYSRTPWPGNCEMSWREAHDGQKEARRTAREPGALPKGQKRHSVLLMGNPRLAWPACPTGVGAPARKGGNGVSGAGGVR